MIISCILPNKTLISWSSSAAVVHVDVVASLPRLYMSLVTLVPIERNTLSGTVYEEQHFRALSESDV